MKIEYYKNGWYEIDELTNGLFFTNYVDEVDFHKTIFFRVSNNENDDSKNNLSIQISELFTNIEYPLLAIKGSSSVETKSPNLNIKGKLFYTLKNNVILHDISSGILLTSDSSGIFNLGDLPAGFSNILFSIKASINPRGFGDYIKDNEKSEIYFNFFHTLNT